MTEPINDPAPAGYPAVTVTQGLPDVEMIVNEGSSVSPSGEDITYVEGETFTVDGPTAIALAAAGFARPYTAADEAAALDEVLPEEAPE